MKLKIYQKVYDLHESLEEFLNAFHQHHMYYLASDLLDKCLSPTDITDAVRRAMLAAKNAGMDVRRHFSPVYTQYDSSIIRDCKLTGLGYALVLLNASPANPAVAKWQLKVLQGVMN